eukprot:3833354-Karenia_brevis.AAC.1
MMLQRPDGSVTANVEEIDNLLHDNWDQFFLAYANKAEPDWQTFYSRFRCAFERHDCQIGPLTGHDIAEAVSRMRSGSSCGME